MLIPNKFYMSTELPHPAQDRYGKRLFVDAKNGNDANSGRRPGEPVKTMSRAFALVRSGDVIWSMGKITEQLDTPAGVFDVTVMGAGTRPRHADNHTEASGKRGSSASTWTAPSSGSTANPLVTVNQQGWKFYGFTFQI